MGISRMYWTIRLAGISLAFLAAARIAHAATPSDGCQLLPKQQVAEVLGKTVDSATPWALAGKFACMYESDAIPGIDLLVNLIIAGANARHQYEQDVVTLHNRSPVAGLGDEAAWSSERVKTIVSDRLCMLSGPYIVNITFLGSPKVIPSGNDDLARAHALAIRVITNAKGAGL